MGRISSNFIPSQRTENCNLFEMASRSEQDTKVLEMPHWFYVGHLIGSKGKTIRDLQNFTRTKINIQKVPEKMFQKNVEIMGYPDDVKMAEELILGIFKENDGKYTQGFTQISMIQLAEKTNILQDSTLKDNFIDRWKAL